jgi:hypothetical protein
MSCAKRCNLRITQATLPLMKVPSRTKKIIAVAVGVGVAAAGAVAVATPAGAATAVTLWPSSARPAVAADPDTASVELGTRFTADVSGVVTGVRYFRGSTANGGTHVGTLWSSTGAKLASATFRNETASGWQQVSFSAVHIAAGQAYTVSYHAPRGRYAANNNYFTAPYDRAPLHAPVSAGVYHYGSAAFPTSTYQASNYWVDVVFTPDGQPSPSPSTSPSPSPSASPSPSPTGSPSPGGGLGLPRIPWEGGPAYYAGKPAAASLNDPSFFPVGVWMESVITSDDTAKDKAAGLNTYVAPTDNSDLSIIRAAGMKVFKDGGLNAGTESVADSLGDEADMTLGPGNDGWNGQWSWDTCTPTQDNGGQCGYTAMSRVLDDSNVDNGRLKYANYGKGVQMWESDTQASQFVNAYTSVVSTDMYFYTDTSLCNGESQTWLGIPSSQCRRAANYGVVMDKLRRIDAMDSVRQPILGFVEVGHPSS